MKNEKAKRILEVLKKKSSNGDANEKLKIDMNKKIKKNTVKKIIKDNSALYLSPDESQSIDNSNVIVLSDDESEDLTKANEVKVFFFIFLLKIDDKLGMQY